MSGVDPNAADQVAAWNGGMGERWLAHHQQLDRFLEPFGAAATKALGSIGGAAGLDIGCGTGATTERLASAIGSNGSTIGIDISQLLVAEASRRPDRMADYMVADAGADDLGGPFDVLYSRFGTMFFPNPARAFSHLRSSLNSRGRLAMVVWQPPSANEWVRLPLEIARRHMELPPPKDGPGPFSLADHVGTQRMLEDSGFADVRVESVRRMLSIGTDALATARFLLAVLPTGPLVDRLESGRAERLAEAIADKLPTDGDVAAVEGAAWVVTARS